MCTGDNVLTARSIATQCGIYTAGGIIMEGPVFRALDPQERIEVVPRLQVLARSSPEDKKILVETLRSLGEIVGVTGDGTNDGPALKTANVGFSMGIAGTEVAKEASDIILMDDNFASIVKAIMWGRCVNDAVRKFLQFQISTNITAVIITFVSAVSSDEEESVLTAVQLLWINIIMDTFAALALATDPASKSLLDRKPDTHGTKLFTADMIKMILGQSIYQVIIILVFHFLGHGILGVDHSDNGNGCYDSRVQRLRLRPDLQLDQLQEARQQAQHLRGYFQEQVFHRDHPIGTSLILRLKRFDTNMMACRNRRSGPHRVRRWCCLPSHSYSRSRVGYLAGSRFRLHPPRCSHSMHPHSTT
jgi:magnesium-transporting ATPase (P-type)